MTSPIPVLAFLVGNSSAGPEQKHPAPDPSSASELFKVLQGSAFSPVIHRNNQVPSTGSGAGSQALNEVIHVRWPGDTGHVGNSHEGLGMRQKTDVIH